MWENMLLPLQSMQICPPYYSDFPLVGLVIELVWVVFGQKAAEVVEVELVQALIVE